MNLLKRLPAHVYSAELTAAAWIDTIRVIRLIPLAMVHQGIRSWIPIALATIGLAANHPSTNDTVITVAVALAVVAMCRVAAKSHNVLDLEDRPCPYCSRGDDGHGGGGPGRQPDDDIPPAPGPLPELTDEQFGEWVGDLDMQMLALHNAWKDGAFR